MCKNRTEYHTNGGRDIEIALEVAMIIRRRRSGQCGRVKKIQLAVHIYFMTFYIALPRVFEIEGAPQKRTVAFEASSESF